jgi:NADH-quinone oxidoreductase subunit F
LVIGRDLNKTNTQRTILFCHGTGCVSGKAIELREAMVKALDKEGITDVKVDFTGCHGFCQQGPIVVIEPEGVFYTHVGQADISDIVKSHIRDGKPVERLFYKDPNTGEPIALYKNIPFYKYQKRIILRNCGHINPERIEDYIAEGGYESARKALLTMTPEQIIDEVKKSGLRGRGGAGFSTGQKWEFCRKAPGTVKYIICNADEGDPGAFMDRSLAEGDPHSVLEGMIIGAFAMGANQGFIYSRAEKPLAIKRFRIALQQAQERGFLGENLFGSGFNFNIELREGAGAFVCGEETALIASIEGKRGMPRPRPPFPAQSGLWGKPTNINNVKSYATVPVIIEKGADWFANTGTETSKGTAVFALTGKISNAGLIEVPMGTPLWQIIYTIGGGIPNKKRFKAVQTGGPSGGCLPLSNLNLNVDYESLKQAGAIMGSGGIVVMDEDSCMVDVAKFFLSFTKEESCGKCISCREGTCKMYDILDRITKGQGKMEDLDSLEELGRTISTASICGLGQTAPNPILTTLRHFRSEYEAHILDKKCPAVVCKQMFRAPCQHTCPVELDVPGYISLIKEKKYQQAYEIIMQRLPLPLSVGRVCPAPCQKKCTRAQNDEAIAIRHLKRYAADYAYEHGFEYIPEIQFKQDEKVAIIGAGPAGLSAAWDLHIDGYQVTIFEALPVAGGMLSVGIPEYRLPKKILNFEIDHMRKMGIEIRLNTRIDDPVSLLEKGYSAVFIAVGAHIGIKMNIPGEDLKGVMDAVDFLQPINLGDRLDIGEKIAIIGGGNSAIDAARVAVRKGAREVHVFYRRERADMPAEEEEVIGAEEEGVKFHFLTAPLKVLGQNGKVVGLDLMDMELKAFDNSGRRTPEAVEGSQHTMPFDMVIGAIGQRPGTDSMRLKGLTSAKSGRIIADQRTLATNMIGVFAGGDAVTGPALVIDAIAAGQRAASSIRDYLHGKALSPTVHRNAYKPVPVSFTPPTKEETQEKPRVHISEIPLSDRKTSFEEVIVGYNPRDARVEASRCLRCDLMDEDED